MIKIYNTKELKDTEQLSSLHNWSFPIEELNYLLKEHNNESFALIEDEERLLEIEEQEKMYIIYEIREENYKIINNLQVNYDIIKVFKNNNDALTYFYNEVNFQCDNDDEWTFKIEENNGVLQANIYYCNEWQNCLYLKEMVVE